MWEPASGRRPELPTGGHESLQKLVALGLVPPWPRGDLRGVAPVLNQDLVRISSDPPEVPPRSRGDMFQVFPQFFRTSPPERRITAIFTHRAARRHEPLLLTRIGRGLSLNLSGNLSHLICDSKNLLHFSEK